MIPTLTRRAALAGLAAGGLLPTLARTAAAQAAAQAIIYTSNSAQAVEAVMDVARAQLPKLKISTVTGGSGQLLRRIEAEAAKPQGDVFWSSSANTMGAFSQLFEPYKVKDSAAFVESLRHPKDQWTAANIHVAVIMMNSAQLRGLPAPKSYADLLDPKFKGKVTIADPANSSTAYTILWGVEKMLGAAGLKALANNVKVTASAPTVLRSVAQGEYPLGLTFESNAYTYVAGGQKEIKLVYAADGTFTTPEFFALIKGAPAGAAARQVCDLLASKEAQIALLENAFRRPARTDIEVGKHADLPELAKIKVFAIDEDEAAAQRKPFLERWAALVAAAGN
ncbi:MAG: extracellular solute-binding protein [Alphaproteobacteria bacterium]|nr:extracellular solute-binding protein [Alphaproteobacteria bacterium]